MISDDPNKIFGYSDEQEAMYKRAQEIQVAEALNLSRLPIEIAIADVDNLENDDYIMVRRNAFGASDSSIILGVNPYKNREELIKEKASTTISAEERAIGDKVAVRKGRELEPLIIEKFTRYFKQHTFKPKDMYKFKDFPYLAVNFDGVTQNKEHYIPAEIKVVTSYGEKHYNPDKAIFTELGGFLPLPQDISDTNNSIQTKAAHYGIPPYYYTQIQQQIFALDAPYGYLSTLHDKDWRFYTYMIWRDQNVINALITEGYKLWQQVEIARHNML